MAQQVDFYSMISGLGDTIAATRKQVARREAFEAINNPDGTVDFNKAILGLTKAGDLEGAARIQQLAGSMEDRRFRQEEAKRAQANADRTFREQQRQFNIGLEGQRVPPGFMQGPNGALVPRTGGPADPKYIQSVTDAKDKGRQMSVTDITKLSEEGKKYSDIGRFSDTFKDEYGGWGNAALGNAANAAGRYLPEGIVGKGTAEASGWWQGYDRYKNVVRNELFGSALTATEQAAFERADINPGMTSKQIKSNLEMQKNVVTNGLKRKANAMISAGYDPKTIGAAYGISLPDIGVSATGRRGAESPQSAASAGGVARPTSKAERDALPPGTKYIAPDGSERTKQ